MASPNISHHNATIMGQVLRFPVYTAQYLAAAKEQFIADSPSA